MHELVGLIQFNIHLNNWNAVCYNDLNQKVRGCTHAQCLKFLLRNTPSVLGMNLSRCASVTTRGEGELFDYVMFPNLKYRNDIDYALTSFYLSLSDPKT